MALPLALSSWSCRWRQSRMRLPGLLRWPPSLPGSVVVPLSPVPSRHGQRQRPAGGAPLLAALLLMLPFAGGAACSAASARGAARLRAWGDGQRLELLPLQQSNLDVLARSRVTLQIRPHDLSHPTLELTLLLPPTLDGRALARQLRLCRTAMPIAGRRARCLQALPLRLEARAERLRLLPLQALSPEEAYGLELLLRNPLQQGFHPLRLFVLSPERPEPAYLGTWLLQTTAPTE